MTETTTKDVNLTLAMGILGICGISDLSSLVGCRRYFIENNGNAVATTMQGVVYSALDLITGRRVIIKCSQKTLTEQYLCKNGTKVCEDVRSEASLLQHVFNHDNNTLPCLGIARFVDFFSDRNHYFLVTEHCGQELLSYISQHHPSKLRADSAAKLKLKNTEKWKKQVRVFFRMIVSAVHFLHTECKIAHLDLSLENLVVDVEHNVCKLIDFGLARRFSCMQLQKKDTAASGDTCDTCDRWKYAGFVGKIPYQAPEIRSIRLFVELALRAGGSHECWSTVNIPDWLYYDARSVDVWALGVILFTMLTNVQPWVVAETSHDSFNYIMDGKIEYVLKQWKCHKFVDEDALDLMKLIFTSEDKRINIEQMMNHKYLKVVRIHNKKYTDHKDDGTNAANL